MGSVVYSCGDKATLGTVSANYALYLVNGIDCRHTSQCIDYILGGLCL